VDGSEEPGTASLPPLGSDSVLLGDQHRHRESHALVADSDWKLNSSSLKDPAFLPAFTSYWMLVASTQPTTAALVPDLWENIAKPPTVTLCGSSLLLCLPCHKGLPSIPSLLPLSMLL
jgi:hypothetical protein